MRRHIFKFIIIISITLFIIVEWFVPLEYNNEGYCSESQLYRYQFAVYECEYNAEAHPDFQCYEKMGRFWSYIGLEKLECEATKDNSDKNGTNDMRTSQDTLAIIKSTLRSGFANFEIVDWVVGDINKDEKGDFVVLIDIAGQRTACLIETVAEDPLILKNVKQNSSLIECSDCGGAGVGDPYRGIEFNNNEIIFKQLYGACCKDEESTTFEYNESLKDWFLIKIEKISSCCHEDGSEGTKTTIITETTDDFGSIKFSDHL
jgi:hypothetical protein